MSLAFWANIAAALSSISAGASIVATRIAIPETDPVSIAFYRYFIGSLCVVPILFAGLVRSPFARGDLLPIIALGALFFGFFPWAFSASVKYTTPAYAAVMQATTPILTLILARLTGRETLTVLKVLSVIAGFFGVFVAFGEGVWGAGISAELMLGNGLMLAAALAAAIFSIFARPYFRRYGPLYVNAASMAIGALSLLPLTIYMGGVDGIPNFTDRAWAAVLFLGVIGGAVQFMLYAWALGHIDASRVVIYLTLNPISAIVLSWLLLDEILTVEALIGLVLVLTGIFLANAKPRATRAKPADDAEGDT